MPKALSTSDVEALAPNLAAWGEAEFQLRSLVSTAQRDDLWPLYQSLSVRQLTVWLYKQRGFSISHEALCPAYDLLRHGRPIDFDLLYEARHTQAVLQRYYCGGKPIAETRLDAWLRAMIMLANTIGTYEPSQGDPASGPLFSSALPPFEIPPGPLEALRNALRVRMTASPPLLAAAALLNTLEAHEALFPGAVDLAAGLLFPGVFQFGFGYAPLAVSNVMDREHWLCLKQMAQSAAAHGDMFAAAQHEIATLLDRADYNRAGGRMPSAIAGIIEEPVFTAQTLAAKINCVSRTTEKLVGRLAKVGIISALQRSGRLSIWSRYVIP